MQNKIISLFKDITIKSCLIILFSSALLAFGLYNVHSLSGVTEGGLLGLNLLLDHWFGISPSITNFVVSAFSYALGWKLLGRKFIIYSSVAAAGFSIFYRIFEQFDPLWPQLYDMPLLAAIAGAIFVGVGTGIVIRIGGALCGDDALVMCISHVTGLRIQWVYLIFDIVVLGLSLSYIPLTRIGYSLITVIISGQIIGFIEKVKLNKEKTPSN